MFTSFPSSTGEKKLKCPDTIKVHGPSGSIVESRCEYRTHDGSLLTKHRSRTHRYIPRPQAVPQRAGTAVTFEFIHTFVHSFSATTSASAATSNVTSSVSKPKRMQIRDVTVQRSKQSRDRVLASKVKDATSYAEHAASDTSPPSTSQGVDEHEQPAYVESSDTEVGSSSAGSNSTMSLVPNEYTSLNTRGEQAYVESPDAAGTLAASSSDTISVVLNEDVSLDTDGQSANEESSHVADSSNIIPVVPSQGIPMDVLFNPATNFDWSKFYAEGFTVPSVTGAHDPAPNSQMDSFATGSFEMNNGLDGPGMEGWDESDWKNLWARFN
ncbi:hypothetical protein J3R83DRAFT_5308 [Lanmaoa asiatica]|nr:hypothetical protein J3R83DRAFT_5308 [Lanmaoa asiatica]